jgi:hypothetical protein
MIRTLSGVMCAPTLLACAVGLTACSDKDSGTEPEEGSGTVIVAFDHTVGGAALVMDGTTYQNAAGNQYTVTNLEYVVSDFVLQLEAVRADGDFSWEGVHYRTQADPSTRELVFDDVPAGDYDRISFVHGIVGSKNTTDAFPELDDVEMAWPPGMGGGYHYMRHEGTFVPDGGGTANFTTHTGPTMGTDYSVPVELVLDTASPARHGFAVVDGDTVTIRLSMDVNQWYTLPNDYDFDDHGPIMSDAGAQVLLQENGATVWSVAEVVTD